MRRHGRGLERAAARLLELLLEFVLAFAANLLGAFLLLLLGAHLIAKRHRERLRHGHTRTPLVLLQALLAAHETARASVRCGVCHRCCRSFDLLKAFVELDALLGHRLVAVVVVVGVRARLERLVQLKLVPNLLDALEVVGHAVDGVLVVVAIIVVVFVVVVVSARHCRDASTGMKRMLLGLWRLWKRWALARRCRLVRMLHVDEVDDNVWRQRRRMLLVGAYHVALVFVRIDDHLMWMCLLTHRHETLAAFHELLLELLLLIEEVLQVEHGLLLFVLDLNKLVEERVATARHLIQQYLYIFDSSQRNN